MSLVLRIRRVWAVSTSCVWNHEKQTQTSTSLNLETFWRRGCISGMEMCGYGVFCVPSLCPFFACGNHEKHQQTLKLKPSAANYHVESGYSFAQGAFWDEDGFMSQVVFCPHWLSQFCVLCFRFSPANQSLFPRTTHQPPTTTKPNQPANSCHYFLVRCNAAALFLSTSLVCIKGRGGNSRS